MKKYAAVMLMMAVIGGIQVRAMDLIDTILERARHVSCGELKKILDLCPSWPEDFTGDEGQRVFEDGSMAAARVLSKNTQDLQKLPLIPIPDPIIQSEMYSGPPSKIIPEIVYAEYPEVQPGWNGTHDPGTVYHQILWIMGYNVRACRINDSLDQLNQPVLPRQKLSSGTSTGPKSITPRVSSNNFQPMIGVAGLAAGVLAGSAATYITMKYIAHK
ncbi:MAG: hypothetical protein LBJ77_01755 [Holosporales bacterium]|jgi:hypothetical protein|nr:hypothetical protein [Holosporales bacterium]